AIEPGAGADTSVREVVEWAPRPIRSITPTPMAGSLKFVDPLVSAPRSTPIEGQRVTVPGRTVRAALVAFGNMIGQLPFASTPDSRIRQHARLAHSELARDHAGFPNTPRVLNGNPLPHRDRKPTQAGVRHQPDLSARQLQHRALLIGEYDSANSAAERKASAGRGIDARNVRWNVDVVNAPEQHSPRSAEQEPVIDAADR